MSKKIILTDVDDTILGWIEGFKRFVENKLNVSLDDYPASWGMTEWLGLPEQDIAKLVDKFNHHSWEFGTLKPILNSNKVLKELHKQDFRFVAITCCSDRKPTVLLRKANIYHVFGDIFEDVICLPLGASKLDVLKKFESTFFIEDNYKYASEGKKAGHDIIMVKQQHNRKYRKNNEIPFVDDWEQIKDIILK